MAERFIGWFCLDMPATLENLFSCRRVEPFATGETRRMAGSCNSFCQALSGISRICDIICDGYFHDREIHGGIFPHILDGFRMADRSLFKNSKRTEMKTISDRDKEIILSIHAYEDSVEMPEDERLTTLVGKTIHLKAGDENAKSYSKYAKECQEYLRFGDDIDLASSGGLDRFSYLKICDTPQVLLTAGFKQKPMLYTQNHLREALKPKSKNHPHRHGFSISEIKRWPELFKAPVILADNPSRDDALLVVLCAVDGDKLPLIASIKPDGKGHYEMDTVETNLVLTVFGKDNYMNYFQGALTPDKIVYIDKKQGQKLERLAERQLFGNYSSLDPNCIIHQPQCIYKLKEMEIVDRARSLTNKVLETRDSCESLASQRNVVEHDSHEERI